MSFNPSLIVNVTEVLGINDGILRLNIDRSLMTDDLLPYVVHPVTPLNDFGDCVRLVFPPPEAPLEAAPTARTSGILTRNEVAADAPQEGALAEDSPQEDPAVTVARSTSLGDHWVEVSE